jgi:hypothetical protein
MPVTMIFTYVLRDVEKRGTSIQHGCCFYTEITAVCRTDGADEKTRSGLVLETV